MRSIAESDLGTPKSPSAETVALTIDGVDVRVPAGTSVLRAAAEAGIGIPKLCATELLDAFGSCRLCLVEIEGMKGFPASCTTPVAAGMKVATQGAKLERLRRGVMELYLSDHPLDACADGFGTEMQRVAERLGVDTVSYGFDGAGHVRAVVPEREDRAASRDRAADPERERANPLFRPVDASNPYFRFDPAQCIVCSRCVR